MLVSSLPYYSQYSRCAACKPTVSAGARRSTAAWRALPLWRVAGKRSLLALCMVVMASMLAAPAAAAAAAKEAAMSQPAWTLAELQRRLASRPLAEVYAWFAIQPPSESEAERLEQHRWLGQMALALGYYTLAAEHFERIIIYQPLDFGIRLDLTSAYLLSGNRRAAQASLNGLEHHLRQQGIDPEAPGQPGLPHAAAERLARLQKQLAEPRRDHAATWLHRIEGSLDIVQGYDSNANLGARRARIPLDLWGEIPAEAALAPESLAQGSHYTELDVDLERPLFHGDMAGGDWQVLAGGRLRHYHQLDALHRRDAYLGLRWQPVLGQSQWLLAMQQAQASGFPAQLSLSADYRRLIANEWLINASMMVQEESRLASSRTLGLGLWRQWQGGLFWVRGSWQQRPERRAGDTWRAELGSETPSLQLGGMLLSATARLQHRGDTSAYSPAFFGQRRRQETIFELGGRAAFSLTPALDLILQADWQRADADIALFENRRWQAEGRLAWRW